MNYKVGDKVRIRTWEELSKEFGINEFGWINTSIFNFQPEKEKLIKELGTNRIVTIQDITFGYGMKELPGWGFPKEAIRQRKVGRLTRFHLMDLSDD